MTQDVKGNQVFTIGMQSLEERPLNPVEREWLGNRFEHVRASSMNTYGEFVYLFDDESGESHYDPCLKIWAWVNGQPNPEFFPHLKRQGLPALVFPKDGPVD